MEEKEIKEGLMSILYNKERDYLFPKCSALNVTSKLYQDLGKDRTEQFIMTYKNKRPIFKGLIDNYIDDIGEDLSKEVIKGLVLPEVMEQIKYDFFSKVENDLKKDNYNIDKLLEKRLNNFKRAP